MSSLAMMLHQSGYRVTGSDLANSALIDTLRRAGIAVAIGHSAANVEAAALVVRSSAVPEENPEVARARQLGREVLKHSEMLGRLSQVRRTLAVAGTHGKTTTTAMLATILIHAGLDPTVLVGGVLSSLGSGARLGQSEYLVVEADEFDRRFLELHPEIAVVNNVEPDHLDYYGSMDAIREAFEAFARLVPEDGWLIVNADNPGARELAESRAERTITFGLSPLANWYAANVIPNDDGGSDFYVYANDHPVGQFHLRVPGRHNVSNALAAAVAAGRVGVDQGTAAEALDSFTGVGRRLERLGEARGVVVLDDYAHHPTKVRASLSGLREHHPGRIICLFQPHHYHRLNSLFEDFAQAFADADVVVLVDVYQPAGRGPEAGERTSADLATAIRGPRVTHIANLDAATDEVARVARPGDIIVTMGAGDVTNAGAKLLRILRERTSA